MNAMLKRSSRTIEQACAEAAAAAAKVARFELFDENGNLIAVFINGVLAPTLLHMALRGFQLAPIARDKARFFTAYLLQGDDGAQYTAVARASKLREAAEVVEAMPFEFYETARLDKNSVPEKVRNLILRR
jgi:hypothetical protein